MFIGNRTAYFSRALEETELILKLLNQQKRGFVRLEERLKSANSDLAREDLAASLQEATDLKQKVEQASAFAREAGKGFYNDDDEEAIDFSERRVDVAPNLSRFTQLQVCVQLAVSAVDRILGSRFPGNLLSSISGNVAHATLTKLDLEGNQITEIRGLDSLVSLEVLDVSYNNLRKIEGLANLAKLKSIRLVHNGIGKIEGLEMLIDLELLDLSDNRIKTIENLDSQRNLRELYLGKNRIRRIENISQLTKLRVLSISANRVTKLENLDTLVDLEKLQVGDSRDRDFRRHSGAEQLEAGRCRLELDRQPRSSGSPAAAGGALFDNKISHWSEVDKLAKLPKLRTVLLADNPVATQDYDDYRRKVIHALPQVTEVDNTPCR